MPPQPSSGYPRLRGQLAGAADPRVAPVTGREPPAWWRPWTYGAGSAQENLAGIMNELIPYVDPATQASFAQQIALMGPTGDPLRYGQVNVPPPQAGAAGGQQYLTPERLAAASNRMRVMEGELRALGSRQPAWGNLPGLRLAQQYLDTAQTAYGTGRGTPTSASRAFARQRLEELEGQAQGRQDMAPFLQVAQSIVNPLLRTPGAGGVGTSRVLSSPTGKPGPGGQFRAPELT